MQRRPASRSPALIRSPLVSAVQSGGLRARLVRAAADAEQPFVVLHEGRYARILLAELIGDDGVALARFAWKLRADLVADGGTLPSNGELDRQWRQERVESVRVRSPHVVAPVAVPSALTQSLPVFYCRRVDSYFHPLCPETGAVLSVCRDDTRLGTAGLPPYEHDTVRYLHHGRPDGSATFYHEGMAADVITPDATDPAPASAAGGANGGARTATRAQLIRGWAALVHGDVTVAEDGTELPCQTCAHRDECYPAGSAGEAIPAERELHVVSFYDVDSLAMELAAADFEAAVTRLGDGGLGGADGGRDWLCGVDPALRMQEVLRLKVAAFADICRGVAAVHAAGRPHLGVSPANVVAFTAAGGSALPANWQWRFALTDLGGAVPVVVPGSGETLWQPGREVTEDATSRLFLAPSLRSLEGGSVTMSVACRARDDDPAALVVDVHRAGVPPHVLPGDLLILTPTGGGVTCSARIDEVGGRGLAATVLLEAGAEAPAWAGTTFSARLFFARRSGPSADLYGLGMMLLRILLVHDEQTLAEVASTVERCLHEMSTALTQGVAGDDLVGHWRKILDGEQGEGRFASWHILHRRAQRQIAFESELQGHPLVPASVWRELMALAGRLLLASPVSRVDEALAEAGAMTGVLGEVVAIERRLQVELFDRAGRDAALATACGQRAVGLRAELEAQSVLLTTMPEQGLPRPAESVGFVLAIGRVGESSIEQHHFVQKRVTIGRREGDNLLLLADPMVSSKHAVIEFDGGDYVLFDVGSTNGTEVDGIRLPVEVPHALDDGSVIHIRPFVLSFRRSDSSAAGTLSTPELSEQQLFDDLCAAYAEQADRGEREVHVGLSAVLDQARAALGRKQLLVRLESLQRRLPALPEQRDESREQLADAALRAMQVLARNLISGDDVDSPERLQEFAGRMQRFVATTSRWIEETLEWRRVLGGQLDLRATTTSGGRPRLRRAQEVVEELLTPTGDDAAASSDYFLARFYDDVLAILEGLLRGNQQVRRALREQLDPARLVELAGREAKLRILVQAAAGSALWQLYVETFEQATAAGGEHEAELERLLQQSAARRAGDGA